MGENPGYERQQLSQPLQIEAFGLFDTNRSVEALTPKKCASIMADSEFWEQCGDFGTRVGR